MMKKLLPLILLLCMPVQASADECPAVDPETVLEKADFIGVVEIDKIEKASKPAQSRPASAQAEDTTDTDTPLGAPYVTYTVTPLFSYEGEIPEKLEVQVFEDACDQFNKGIKQGQYQQVLLDKIIAEETEDESYVFLGGYSKLPVAMWTELQQKGIMYGSAMVEQSTCSASSDDLAQYLENLVGGGGSCSQNGMSSCAE
ncbi:MAG: hypothetical protein JKY71_03050 [Alphaproteobacteria bacterium]|nr:hypothetical protein [Alphaproteobacteria bacterium]